MKKMPRSILALLCCGMASLALAETTPDERKQFQHWSGPYAGVGRDSYIYKFVDTDVGVVCYVMQPKDVGYKIGAGYLQYEGNSVGALSCVKLPESGPRKSP
ncbi:MAG: hypothetical protein LBV49_08150 [Azonexus sp.]|jgi:hypothetical protein|nr:hypothetical protein [Azonexus sp.]